MILSNFTFVVCYVCHDQVRRAKDEHGFYIDSADQVWASDSQLVKDLKKRQEPVSHGLCPECLKGEKKKLEDYMKARG